MSAGKSGAVQRDGSPHRTPHGFCQQTARLNPSSTVGSFVFRCPSLASVLGGSAVAITFRRDHVLVRAGDGRWVRWRLPSDFVTPSPTEPNLASSVEAARAVQAALRPLGASGSSFSDAVIALPDRAAHAALSEGAGSRAARRLRTELVRGLATTWAPSPSELDGRFRFGTLASGSLGHRSLLGAVTGAPVVQQYEAAAEAAGLRVRWVDATSLAALPEWRGTRLRQIGSPSSPAAPSAPLRPRRRVWTASHGFPHEAPRRAGPRPPGACYPAGRRAREAFGRNPGGWGRGGR